MKIDSHQHFWKYHPVKDAWISEEMKIIQQDFLPAELYSLLVKNNIDGCVAIQADQSEEETHFLLHLAQENDFILGVVGWIDFKSDTIEERLEYFSQFKKLKGFRHIVQAEVEDDFLLGEDFCNGIEKLAKYNFTFDLLITTKHLLYATAFVKRFPNHAFVIDHLAKPDFKQADFKEWEKGIKELATYSNVYCKVSGMVTEADWKNWKEEDFTYCLDIVTNTFGINRLLFGSDWPVSLLAATYKQSCNIVKDYFSKFSKEDQDKFWGRNARKFYHL
ncbi:amidohydrolase [Flavobacterium circumlabens]|uniref:Amidohydrolase n=1 Tax=Flavobacterium circumlabens TaxID=2133765 RepID=A0A4Y7UES6_9FLAO|nr:amidohydrolase family protein [Flavobacterium circumlabens]TCN59582.1 L-fuconolactonase [Flavobacterium circumlabens]TEB44864.1 amidohydrolase [Flavobacterium circumlabens]